MGKPTLTGRQLKRRIALIWLVLLSLFVGELLFYTWCRVECVQTGYAISAESRKQKELQLLQNSLKIELARLKAPENISRIARERLALAMPEPEQIIVVP
jgi:cell division protein FtsL